MCAQHSEMLIVSHVAYSEIVAKNSLRLFLVVVVLPGDYIAAACALLHARYAAVTGVVVCLQAGASSTTYASRSRTR